MQYALIMIGIKSMTSVVHEWMPVNRWMQVYLKTEFLRICVWSIHPYGKIWIERSIDRK